MHLNNLITAIDLHACGEPGRVITGGVLDVPGKTMFEKMKYFEKHHNDIRLRMLREPRGAKQRLEHDQPQQQQRQPRATARLAPIAPAQHRNRQYQQTQRPGEITMGHFLPGLGMRHRPIGPHRQFGIDRFRGVMRRHPPITAGPVGASQSGIGKPHISAQAHHPQSQDQRQQNKVTVKGHGQPIWEALSNNLRSFIMPLGSGFSGNRSMRLPSGSTR